MSTTLPSASGHCVSNSVQKSNMTFFDGTTNLLTLDSPSTVALINEVREQIEVGRLAPDPVPGDVIGHYRCSEELLQLVENLQYDLRVSGNRTIQTLLRCAPTKKLFSCLR